MSDLVQKKKNPTEFNCPTHFTRFISCPPSPQAEKPGASMPSEPGHATRAVRRASGFGAATAVPWPTPKGRQLPLPRPAGV